MRFGECQLVIREVVGWLAFVMISCCNFGCSPSIVNEPHNDASYLSGQTEARSRIKNGNIMFIDAIGIKRSETVQERMLLDREYGIKYVDGMCLSPNYVSGFNYEMSREAESRFGVGYRSELVHRRMPQLGYPRTRTRH
jgi:hypothetical protein